MRPDATRQALEGEHSLVRFALPAELIATDRILSRWAAGSGTGLPSDEWNDQPVAKLTPLPDAVAVDVDLIITKLVPRTKRIVIAWYRTPEPAESIARKLGMSRSSLYRAHKLCLNHMRWKFEGSENPDLVHMVRRFDP